jgi:hypothetical protein
LQPRVVSCSRKQRRYIIDIVIFFHHREDGSKPSGTICRDPHEVFRKDGGVFNFIEEDEDVEEDLGVRNLRELFDDEDSN